MQQGGDKLTLPYNGPLTSTQTVLASSTTRQSVETDIDNILNDDDNDSIPLLPPRSPIVTVAHTPVAGGKKEIIQLTPESSSVSPKVLVLTISNDTDSTTKNTERAVDELDDEKEILFTEGPAAASSVTFEPKRNNDFTITASIASTASLGNPFTNPFLNANGNATTSTSSTAHTVAADNGNNSNPFDQFDAITAALLTSTNPFHNPFLMPTTNESEVDGSQGAQVKQEVENPGCTKESLDRVSLLDGIVKSYLCV